MSGPRILLVVGGGIAAYKSCELVRLIRKGANGVAGNVTCVLTEGGSKFVTAMALGALSENPVHTTLWDLKNEVEMGHIQLSRQADLVVVCPATADLLAKMAAGIADDLATTLLLATDKPVLAVPAMNVRMWQHAATVRNVEKLRASGVEVMEPDVGAMACGEFGPGRLPEPDAVWKRIARRLGIVPDEPEDEVEDEALGASEDSGLGGLSASLIVRGVKRPEIVFEDPMPFEGEDSLPEDFVIPVEDAPPLDLGGPVLSRKGKARAAPPTDPDAINHEVSRHGDAIAPQPFEGTVGPGFESLGMEPEDLRVPMLDSPEPEDDGPKPLAGKHVLVTAGPTYEPIDPVRYIANRSSGKQGFAIAAAAAAAGARVTLVSGPVHLATPRGVDRIDVETAREMADAVKKALPADIAIMVAAVADWRTQNTSGEKIKKRGSAPPALLLTENPDILAGLAASAQRPKLLVGFAAETDHVLEHAKDKRKRKGVDWIIANDVSGDVMGGAVNTVHIVTAKGVEHLDEMPKEHVARAIIERIADAVGQ